MSIPWSKEQLFKANQKLIDENKRLNKTVNEQREIILKIKEVIENGEEDDIDNLYYELFSNEQLREESF